ncbi:helix-hairpin-helix domain-containing protein [Candidatus Albibeggiatoa sp. nov. NOAA]|uniref:ComEA family DNA-binding protein n=1 Tax=Candidatus Albibeggiatoa sp. nov. NOAA TaxID=3162724 RepID=UPI0032F71ACB|nr:helix-hairpin-helix domain-containing protein [Thiotrichaceae bacterium]
MRLLKILFLTLSFFAYSVYAETTVQVNINTAGAAELKEVLSGVGEKKSQAIVDYRNTHGVFNSAYDLMLVNGIGKKTVEKNLDRIILADPATESVPENIIPAEMQPNSTPVATSQQTEQATQTIPVQIIEGQAADIEPDFSDVQITPELLEAVKNAVQQDTAQ